MTDEQAREFLTKWLPRTFNEALLLLLFVMASLTASVFLMFSTDPVIQLSGFGVGLVGLVSIPIWAFK